MLTRAFTSPKVIAYSAIGLIGLVGAVWGISVAASGDAKEPSLLPTELSKAALTEQARQDPGKLFETMRERGERDDLTEEQRRELRENMRSAMTAMLDERVDEYFAAADDDKNAVLDKQIDEFQERMKEWQKRREERERDSAREGDDKADEREQARRDRWRNRPVPTRAERKARSESRNADDMARRMAYFTAIRKRATERGIDLPGPGGRGGRGGPGGGRGRGG